MTGLRRSLGVRDGTAMAVGAVLGPSVLVLPAITARIAGPGALVAWAGMSLWGLALAITLGRAGARIPHAGGIVAYVEHAFGPRLTQVCGWWFLASVPFAVPVIALVGANYVTAYFAFHPTWTTAIAALLLGVSCWLNMRGLRTAGWVQVGLVAFIAAVLVVVTVVGMPTMSVSAFEPFLSRGWSSVGLAALLIFWSYIGLEMVVHLAEEFRQPARDLPLSMGLASVVLSALYCAAAVVTVGTGAYLVGSGLAPMSVVAESSLGPAAGAATAVFALCCSFVAVHTNIAGFSRLLYARARDGALPEAFARVHRHYHTPTAALGVQAVFFALVLVANYVFAPDLAELIAWPSSTFAVLYLAGAAAAVKMLPATDVGRYAGVIAFLGCLLILPFGGWACLYPLGVLLVSAGASRLRKAMG